MKPPTSLENYGRETKSSSPKVNLVKKTVEQIELLKQKTSYPSQVPTWSKSECDLNKPNLETHTKETSAKNISKQPPEPQISKNQEPKPLQQSSSPLGSQVNFSGQPIRTMITPRK